MADFNQQFKIGFNNSINSLHSARKNLQGTTLHLEVVDEYFKDELALNRFYGPYPKSISSTCRLTDLMLFPKVNHQPNTWCLSIDLSHPQGHIANDNIPKTLYGLFYIIVDNAIGKILKYGPTPYW